MNVQQLIDELVLLPSSSEVFFRRVAPICGNIESVGHAKSNTYGFFGKAIPCVIIEPQSDEEEDGASGTAETGGICPQHTKHAED